MYLQEKRYQILNLLDKAEARAIEWKRHEGQGVLRKIERLFLTPKTYIRYLRFRFDFAHDIVKTKTFWGHEMVLSCHDLDAFAIWAFGTLGNEQENKVTRFLVRTLQSSDIFYDIGANYGFYTVLASEFIREGEIHAFEPLVGVFGFLKQNIQLGSSCTLNNCVLSDKEGILPFYLGAVSSGSSSMLEDAARASAWNRHRHIEVASTTLDTYVNVHKAPTVMKMDVEGAEYAIIRGGYTFFREEHPVIIMEVWEKDKGEKFSLPAIKALYALGYRSYKLTSEGNVEQRGTDALSLIGDTFDNVVFRK